MNLKHIAAAAFAVMTALSCNTASMSEWAPVGDRIMTVWGENLDPSDVLAEYPRPQMQREHYQMLHGEWDYAIVPQSDEYTFESQGKILVPFSPETLLSGVERQLQPDEYLWYQKVLSFT